MEPMTQGEEDKVVDGEADPDGELVALTLFDFDDFSDFNFSDFSEFSDFLRLFVVFALLIFFI